MMDLRPIAIYYEIHDISERRDRFGAGSDAVWRGCVHNRPRQ